MRYALVPILLLCVALTTVGVGVFTLLERNREAQWHQFAVERQAQLDEATRGVAETLEDVAEDLRFAGELMSQPGTLAEHRREMRALLEAVGQYKVLIAYDASGKEWLRMLDRRMGKQVARAPVLAQMAEAARRALLRPPGDITLSPPMEEGGSDSLRVMATALPVDEQGRPEGAVAVLVDTTSFFTPLRIVTSDPDARLLLLGTYGHPTSASDATLADWFRRLETEGALVPGFTTLAARMREGSAARCRCARRRPSDWAWAVRRPSPCSRPSASAVAAIGLQPHWCLPRRSERISRPSSGGSWPRRCSWRSSW